MATDLRDELARLADGTPPSAPPDDLWSRGVRRKRRGRAVATLATVAAVLVSVGVSTVGWDAVRTTEPVPTAADAIAIPTRLETPSPFTASTADGPIGPLAVIAGAERRNGWLGVSGSAKELVGISATTGEYRFLDLPGLVAESDAPFGVELEPVLSPDGRSVAYWLGQTDHPGRVGGFAVYDTVSGEVTRHEVDNDLGLSADGMQWIDPETVLVTFGQVVELLGDGGSAEGVRSRLWSPSSDRLTDLEGRPTLWEVSPLDFGLADPSPNVLRVWDGDSGERVARVPVTGGEELAGLVLDPSGRTVVAMKQRSSTSTSRLFVGTVAEAVELQPLRSEVALWDLLGWQDGKHVVARGVVPGTGSSVAAVFSVDVRTGAATELVREVRDSWGAFPQYASDLWDRPTAVRPGPDRVLDPRLRAAGAGALVLVLGGAVHLVRRRRARA